MKYLITDDSVRHRWFVSEVASRFEDVRWIPCRRDRASWYRWPDHPDMHDHFARWADTERRWFTGRTDDGLLEERAEPPAAHPDDVDVDADVVVLYSTPIVRGRLLDLPNLWVVHAGLVPWYRGSSTNVLPLAHGRPDLVGMSLLTVSRNVDEGDIILQGRPPIFPDDDSHTIGCRNTEVAARMVVRAFGRYDRDSRVPTVPQPPGRTWLKSDWTIDALHAMRQNIEAGMLADYRPGPLEIVEW